MATILKIIGGLLGLLAVAAAVFVATFDLNDWKGWIEERATTALGRQVRIEGPLGIAWGWTPELTVGGLTVANAEWGDAPHLAKVERLKASIDLWEQVQGRTVLPEIKLIGPDLFLHQRSKGEANWTFGETGEKANQEEGVVKTAAEEAVLPEDRTELPVIEKLVIADGQFEYLDDTRKIDLAGWIDTATGDGGGGDKVEIDGEGRLDDEALTLSLTAGAFTRLREPDVPYPVDLSVTLGKTEASIEGTLTRPFELAGVDLSLAISGQSLADVFPITGIPLPPTPPYRLSGDLVRAGGLWRFTDFDGRLGDSDLRGTMEIDLTKEPLSFDTDLVSDKLDVDDLAGFIGAPTQEKPEQERDSLIPDTEINLDRLQAANGEARLRAKKILAPDLPINDLDAELTLEDGVLRLEPAGFGIAKGTVDLWISLYGAQDPAQIDMLTHVRDLQLKEAFRGSGYVQETGGKIDGRIKLSGRGNSLHEMLDDADGESYLVMSDGRVSAFLLELAGLDAMEALGLYFGESDDDARVPIRCLATDFKVEDGMAETKLAVLDTRDTLIEADGVANLGEERLDLVFTPHPKDISLLNLRSKVHVEGPFLDPSVSLDAGSILKFVPPIDWGTTDSAPCDKLITKARGGDS